MQFCYLRMCKSLIPCPLPRTNYTGSIDYKSIDPITASDAFTRCELPLKGLPRKFIFRVSRTRETPSIHTNLQTYCTSKLPGCKLRFGLYVYS